MSIENTVIFQIFEVQARAQSPKKKLFAAAWQHPPTRVILRPVHCPPDSRLLSNLLQQEKEYSLILKASNTSLASFTTYAAASPPPGPLVIMLQTRLLNDVRWLWMNSFFFVVVSYILFFQVSSFRVTQLIKASNSKKPGPAISGNHCSSTTSDFRRPSSSLLSLSLGGHHAFIQIPAFDPSLTIRRRPTPHHSRHPQS